MSERMDQARAEAREYARPQMLPVQTVSEHREEAFLDGWRAADANPKPRTITRKRAHAVAVKASDRFGGIVEPDAVRLLLGVAFLELGIEVVDGE